MWMKLINGLTVALVVISIFQVIALTYIQRTSPSFYAADSKFPLSSGYLSGPTVKKADRAPCVLLRMSSDRCRYCRMDQPFYKRLIDASRLQGCASFVLSPKTGQIDFRDDGTGTQYWQFVDYQVGRYLDPFLTPQTILLDSEGRVRWFREGTMDARSLTGAMRAMDILRQTSD